MGREIDRSIASNCSGLRSMGRSADDPVSVEQEADGTGGSRSINAFLRLVEMGSDLANDKRLLLIVLKVELDSSLSSLQMRGSEDLFLSDWILLTLISLDDVTETTP